MFLSLYSKNKQTLRPAQPCRKQVGRNITKNLFPLIFNIMGALRGNITLLLKKSFLWGSSEKKTKEEERYLELTEGRERKGSNSS